MSEPKQTSFPLLTDRTSRTSAVPDSDNVFGIYESPDQARSKAVGIGLLVIFYAVVLIWVL